MKHLGDITRIDGRTVPRVEVVIGGSPCQDLSVAGKRAGLAGERSGLFMEQIRIVKEMRERDIRSGRTGADAHPRWMVWENVPGALSSGDEKGEDFRAVLEETARVADNRAAIPRYEGGSWRMSGVIVGDGWSIAWRVPDAQHWGVPQRRRRICLVADFAGDTAPRVVFDILRGDASAGNPVAAVGRAGAGDGPEVRFVSDSLSWDLETGGTEREGVAGAAERGAREAGGTICIQGNSIDRSDTAGCGGRGWNDEDVSYTLNTIDRPAVMAFRSSPGKNAYGMELHEEVAPVITSAPGRNIPAVYDARGNGDGETAPTITGDHFGHVNDYMAVCVGNGQADNTHLHEMAPALSTMHDQQAVMVRQTVRRLTPLECERLQGYPDGWTDIGDWTDSKGKARKTTDAARYRALGNSIALPYWRVMLSRLIRYCRDKTMASLFDGIGGFPFCWNSVGGVTVWASEIDEFAIAVTRRRFGDEKDFGPVLWRQNVLVRQAESGCGVL